MVRATITNGYNIKGARKFVTHKASEYTAQYASDDHQDSIFYEGANLKIVLMFPSTQGALRFSNSLQDLQARVGGDEVDSIVDASEEYQGYYEVLSRAVRFSDYKPEDSGSPSVTSRSRESQVVTEQGSYKDVVVFQSIERLDCLSLGYNSCHIRGKPHCSPYQMADPNNVLAMTLNGHHYFDAYTNSAHSVPTIRLSVLDVAEVPEECFSVEYNENQYRFRVDILVEFANTAAFGFGMLLKAPYVRGDQPLTRKTFVRVLDTAAFSGYIQFKYDQTTDRGFEVSM